MKNKKRIAVIRRNLSIAQDALDHAYRVGCAEQIVAAKETVAKWKDYYETVSNIN
jgi:hypothetical protein